MLESYNYNNCYSCLATEATFTKLVDTKAEIRQTLLICVPELKWDDYCMFCSKCVVQLELIHEFREKCLASQANRNNQIIIKTEEDYISDIVESATCTDLIEVVKHDISESYEQEQCQEKVIEETVHIEQKEPEGQDNTQSTTITKPKKPKIYKKVACKFCDHFCFAGSQLSNHIRARHTFEKPFKCDLCDKSFPALSMLRTHRRVHSDEREYSCAHCGECFKFRTNMRVHILSKHEDPENWKHVCSYCNKRFPIKKSLDMHVMKHTGEKKFVCNVCNKSFYDASTLRKHNRIHSNERPFKCDLCPKDYKRNYDVACHKKKAHNVDLLSVPQPGT